uniref:Uncharacterized protein n=2 Tax=Timema TaxID=61471 RepID=A0A7R9CFK4_TIMPO|nr:unnamed protein product [Timema douglasi]CAD7395547.1 unnamed protein product [Timema poppensis]
MLRCSKIPSQKVKFLKLSAIRSPFVKPTWSPLYATPGFGWTPPIQSTVAKRRTCFNALYLSATTSVIPVEPTTSVLKEDSSSSKSTRRLIRVDFSKLETFSQYIGGVNVLSTTFLILDSSKKSARGHITPVLINGESPHDHPNESDR